MGCNRTNANQDVLYWPTRYLPHPQERLAGTLPLTFPTPTARPPGPQPARAAQRLNASTTIRASTPPRAAGASRPPSPPPPPSSASSASTTAASSAPSRSPSAPCPGSRASCRGRWGLRSIARDAGENGGGGCRGRIGARRPSAI
jgi:hypothetical protein